MLTFVVVNPKKRGFQASLKLSKRRRLKARPHRAQSQQMPLTLPFPEFFHKENFRCASPPSPRRAPSFQILAADWSVILMPALPLGAYFKSARYKLSAWPHLPQLPRQPGHKRKYLYTANRMADPARICRL